MPETTATEENYLKAIYKYTQEDTTVSTNTLSAELRTTPGTVTDMIKKLKDKQLVEYTPYKGVSLSGEGLKIALYTLRKHRLWEVFLVEKLHFTWDEVHDTAEELEHINSHKLVQKLDEFLNYPRFDPHGDPIPDEHGVFLPRDTRKLTEVQAGETVILAAVTTDTPEFLQYLNRMELCIGQPILLLEIIEFDASRLLKIHQREISISQRVAEHLLVVSPDQNYLTSSRPELPEQSH